MDFPADRPFCLNWGCSPLTLRLIMKRIFACLCVCCLAVVTSPAQDAATEEKLNKILGQFEDIITMQKAQQKQLAELSAEISAVRERASRPNEAYATQDDLRKLAESVREIDRKRIDDSEKIERQLLDLGKTLSAAARKPARDPEPETSRTNLPDKGYEYIVQSGDTISVIVQAYRDKNIKITVDQVLKANPGLNPSRLKVGQKIFIPAPQ
jgi:septal ring factor EnvC (AmiA/AmiB activator)